MSIFAFQIPAKTMAFAKKSKELPSAIVHPLTKDHFAQVCLSIKALSKLFFPPFVLSFFL